MSFASLPLSPMAGTSLLNLCEGRITDRDQRRPLERLCALMRKRGAETYIDDRNIHERDYFPDLYKGVAAEVRELREHDNVDPTSVVVDQLSFFGVEPAKLEKLRQTVTTSRDKLRVERSLLGSCVMIRFKEDGNERGYIFEAAIAVPAKAKRSRRLQPTEFIHVAEIADVPIGGEKFEIECALFVQQNGLTSACAHAALKTAIWHSSAVTEFQIPTARMNEIAAQHLEPGEQWKASDGLSDAQCRAICREFGADLLVVSFRHNLNPHISPYEIAYLLVENAIPTIMVFQPEDGDGDRPMGHTVPVVGHTINTDEWFPAAITRYTDIPTTPLNTTPHGYMPTVEWVPHLIVHDDMLGPYFKLGPRALTRRPDTPPGLSYCGHACAVWAIVPEGFDINLSPQLAQELAKLIIERDWREFAGHLSKEWRDRLEERWPANDPKTFARNLILRTVKITSDDYMQHLLEAEDHLGGTSKDLSDQEATDLESCFKDDSEVWMVEFSFPEIFGANLSKVGEVILPLGAARNPALFYTLRSDDPLPPPLSFRILGGIYGPFAGRLDLGFTSHIPMYSRKE